MNTVKHINTFFKAPVKAPKKTDLAEIYQKMMKRHLITIIVVGMILLLSYGFLRKTINNQREAGLNEMGKKFFSQETATANRESIARLCTERITVPRDGK